MPPSDRFLIALEDSSLWLLERAGAAMSRRRISRAELAADQPRLLRALQSGDYRDCPRIVTEPQG